MNRFASYFILAVTSFVVDSIAGYVLFMLAAALIYMTMWTRLIRDDRIEAIFGVINKQSVVWYCLGCGVAAATWVLSKKSRFKEGGV